VKVAQWDTEIGGGTIEIVPALVDSDWCCAVIYVSRCLSAHSQGLKPYGRLGHASGHVGGSPTMVRDLVGIFEADLGFKGFRV
jgi:hypothetical protein